MEECATCRFWKDGNDAWDHKGQCARYPQSVTTTKRHWCGEYAQKQKQ